MAGVGGHGPAVVPPRRRRWRWLRRPAPTIRLRLTALYGTVFLITGAVLLTVGYVSVANDLRARHSLHSALLRLGFDPDRGHPYGQLPNTSVKLIRDAQDQIVSSALHRLLIVYIATLLVMTAVSVVSGWLLAGRALHPLRRITATARRVSGENLGERIALRGPADELKELADTFDGMLERLDGAFASQRHFVASASHELRTPLAILRTEVDVALGDPEASRGDLRQMAEAVRETVDRCERLIASLLLLARSEAAAGPAEPVDVAALAGDCITDLWARAQEARIQIQDELEPAWCSADPGLLERLIANLIDNGIHHNEAGGWLRVRTRAAGDRAEILVANGGPRIDPAQVQELVQPFRRLNRSERGFGLGLSIVASIARAHRGSVTLRAPDGGGLEVRVTLPLLRTARPARGAVMVTSAPITVDTVDPQTPLTPS